jgi:hypothetical protein
MTDKIEKRTSMWMGIFITVLALIYILTTLGKTTWISWIAIVFGFFLAGFLFIQSGILTYFKKDEYRKIGVGDVVVWLTIIFAVGVLLNTLLIIEALKNIAPEWLISFSRTIGVTVGVGAGILGIVHIFFPRFK